MLKPGSFFLKRSKRWCPALTFCLNFKYNEKMYDLLIIGGGINGAGIARDAAGRGLSVMLVERDDLAQATSSASTKLIHGGLRYLEHYEFKLVKEALNERERLLRSAPHIIHPLEFILPHDPYLRPKWMIRLGLYLYDFLGKRAILSASKAVKFGMNRWGAPLQDKYKSGFSYRDCWVEDARLVTLCAMDAKEKGAVIKTRTSCETLSANGRGWDVVLRDTLSGEEETLKARAIVNAAGPWVREILEQNDLADQTAWRLRHSKGSHIVVPRLYEGDHAYILQQPDKRIVFAIPFERDFTLIGTTDTPVESSALNDLQIDEEETAYLCTAISRSFKTKVTKEMVVWSYSGVRGLLDSEDDNLAEVTRDYKLDLALYDGAPLLNIVGGKITTFRKLSEQACDKLCATLHKGSAPWTEHAALPGGDIKDADFESFLKQQGERYPFLNVALLERYAHSYGTRMDVLLDGVRDMNGLGTPYGDDIYEAELRYGIRAEWVRTAEDFLWRRSKLGLHITDQTRRNLEEAISTLVKEARS